MPPIGLKVQVAYVTPNLSDSLKAGDWIKPLVYEMTIGRCACACTQTESLCTSQKMLSRSFQRQPLRAAQQVRWNSQAIYLQGYLSTAIERQVPDPQLLIWRLPSSLPLASENIIRWLNKKVQRRSIYRFSTSSLNTVSPVLHYTHSLFLTELSLCARELQC